MKLLTLGQLRLDGPPLARPKPLMLLAYLAVQGPQHRSHLAALFFPESRDRADALSTSVRHLTAIGAVQVRGTQVQTEVACDALELLQALPTAPQEAVDLYRGAFLDGLTLSIGAELEDWLLSTREQLAATVRQTLILLASSAKQAGQQGPASALARRALDVAAAPPLSPEEFTALYPLLARGDPQRRQLQLEAQELGLVLPELPTLGLEPLPRSLTSFVGRNEPRLQVLELLTRSGARLLTLHGPGGIGKTRLAIQLAHDVLNAQEFVDGVAFVALDALTDPAAVLPSLAAALQLPSLPGEAALDTLARGLAGRQLLCVLDNFEHLMDAADQVPTLLDRCPGLHLVITSRERLGLKSEWVITLDGLTVPTPESSLETAVISEALDLFVARARQVRADFQVTAHNLPALMRLCAAVDGLPLGLELSAAWMHTHRPEELAERLEQNALGLSTPLRDVRPRHRSLEGALSSSWTLLNADLQDALKCLAVFRGSFTTEAAAWVADATQEQLDALVNRALVQPPQDGRYGLHVLLQQFALARLNDAPERLHRTTRRHAEYYAGQLHALNVQGSGAASGALIGLMQTEAANLAQVLDHATEAHRHDLLERLAEPLLWGVALHGGFQATERRLRAVVAALSEEPAADGARAALLTSLSWLEFYAGNTEASRQLAQDAVGHARVAGHPLQLLRALDGLGQALTRAGRFPEAIEALREALELARGVGDDTRLMRSLNNLTLALGCGGDLTQAQQLGQEALALWQGGAVSPGMDVVWLLGNVAIVELLAGRTEAACVHARVAAEIAAVQTPGMLTVHRSILAVMLTDDFLVRGGPQLEEVRALCDAGLETAQLRGETVAQVFFDGSAGRALLEAGHVEEAVDRTRKAVVLAWQTGNLLVLGLVLPYFIEALFALGEHRAAMQLLGATLYAPNVMGQMRGPAVRTYLRPVPGVSDVEVSTWLQEGASRSLAEMLRRVKARQMAPVRQTLFRTADH